MSALEAVGFWKNFPDAIDDFLADQLISRRIALVLGAGVSQGAGLPNWQELVHRLYESKGIVPDPALSPEKASEDFYSKYYNDKDKEFAGLVRDVLYIGTKLDPTSLGRSPLLNAIGAILTASTRGSAGCAITFNYDDLLESHLRYRGFVVNAVYELPAWNKATDMLVLHAHGYLPSEKSLATSKGIVLTRMDYDRVIGKSDDIWNQRMLDIFRSHTCIFIGLSGDDARLTSLLSTTKDHHRSCLDKHAFWGVRAVASDADLTNGTWTDRGVYCRSLGSYDDIPNWLFNICRLAAKKRS